MIETHKDYKLHCYYYTFRSNSYIYRELKDGKISDEGRKWLQGFYSNEIHKHIGMQFADMNKWLKKYHEYCAEYASFLYSIV